MKELKLFQWFINAAIVVFVLAVSKYLYEYPIAILMEKASLYGMELSNEGNTILVKVLAFIKIIIVLMFVQAINFLRLTMKCFLTKNYFENRITVYFRKAGYLIVTVGLLSYIFTLAFLKFRDVFLIDFRFALILAEDHFFNPIFSIFIGLFFVIVSSAFANAKAIKQENDLTI